jgi:FkbM family methyltransferase
MINPIWFIRNLHESSSVTRDIGSLYERMAWIYSDKFSAGKPRIRRRLLRLKYPPPIGMLDILVRDNHGSDNFILGEVFHHNYYAPPPKVRDIKSIVDLGANAGFTSLYYSRLFPEATLIAVEPHPDNATMMRANFLLNNVRAEIVEAACVVSDGRVQLEIHPMDYGHQIQESTESPKDATRKSVGVVGVSMPTLLSKFNVDEVSILKVDIEGYEKTLLNENADWLDCVRSIVIEWHFPNAVQELSTLAQKHGFCAPELHRGQLWLLRP